jgi:hypothetical protein
VENIIITISFILTLVLVWWNGYVIGRVASRIHERVISYRMAYARGFRSGIIEGGRNE